MEDGTRNSKRDDKDIVFLKDDGPHIMSGMVRKPTLTMLIYRAQGEWPRREG